MNYVCKTAHICITICIVSLFSLCSCDEAPKKNEPGYENELRGSVEILCDEAVYPLISSVKPTYDSAFPDAQVTLRAVTAREAIEQLLTGNAKGIILGRQLLPREDSLIKAYNLKFPDMYAFAFDAVVFAASKTAKVPDTINLRDAQQYFRGESDVNPFGTSNTTLYFPGVQSSVYSHFLQYVTMGKAPKKSLVNVGNSDSVLLMAKNNNAIALSLLSRTLRDSTLKNIRIGFYDTSGNYVAPRMVHQANIVRDYYPMEMPIIGILQQNRPKLAYGFFTYLSKEAKIQRQFNAAGIVPGFATIHLIQD